MSATAVWVLHFWKGTDPSYHYDGRTKQEFLTALRAYARRIHHRVSQKPWSHPEVRYIVVADELNVEEVKKQGRALRRRARRRDSSTDTVKRWTRYVQARSWSIWKRATQMSRRTTAMSTYRRRHHSTSFSSKWIQSFSSLPVYQPPIFQTLLTRPVLDALQPTFVDWIKQCHDPALELPASSILYTFEALFQSWTELGFHYTLPRSYSTWIHELDVGHVWKGHMPVSILQSYYQHSTGKEEEEEEDEEKTSSSSSQEWKEVWLNFQTYQLTLLPEQHSFSLSFLSPWLSQIAQILLSYVHMVPKRTERAVWNLVCQIQTQEASLHQWTSPLTRLDDSAIVEEEEDDEDDDEEEDNEEEEEDDKHE